MRVSAVDRNAVVNRLRDAGISYEDAWTLRRISIQLHAWHEKECGNGYGHIERDETTNKPYWLQCTGTRFPMRALEMGALNRRQTILVRYGDLRLRHYIQTDPRGCALYILTQAQWMRHGKASISTYYNEGIAVY